jgi:hypothetical protein
MRFTINHVATSIRPVFGHGKCGQFASRCLATSCTRELGALRLQQWEAEVGRALGAVHPGSYAIGRRAASGCWSVLAPLPYRDQGEVV